MSHDRTPDEQADAVIAEQHGAISRRQALEAGLTRHQIESRLARGRWLHPVRGVFVAASVPETWRQKAMVACLAGPAGTVASHLTAAALLGLVDPPEAPHVTVTRGVSGRLGGAVVHRVRRLLEPPTSPSSVVCLRPPRLEP